MKNFISFILSFFFAFVSLSFAQTPTGETEIRTAKVHFKVNSSKVYSMYSAELREVANSTIISIEGYASIEGNSVANHTLSQARAEEVKNLFRANSADVEISYFGGTEAFGPDYKDNRVVIVTYAVLKTSTPALPNMEVGSIDAEGFHCGNRIDGSVYFEDTMNIETTIPAPIVLETISIEPSNNIAMTVTPVVADTLFLPLNQAVRFQMRKHGLSREQAIKSVEARKSQWKPLKHKKAKPRKVSLRPTKGMNRTLLVRIFPFAGC